MAELESKGLSIWELMAVGQVLLAVPRESVDRALGSTDRRSRREGRFPDHLVVYFVLLIGLFMDLSYDRVFEKLKGTLRWLYAGIDGLSSLTNSAIVKARQRIGAKPLESLFRLIAVPLCTFGSPYGFLGRLRVVIIDGSTFCVADSEDNARSFGKSKNQHSESGLPHVRCVSLVEYGSRAVLDLAFGPYKGSTEEELCKQILNRLKKDVVCLGDRLYASYENCRIVLDSGAHFLFRVRKDVKLKPYRRLSDGSYLAKMFDSKVQKRPRPYVVVRVVEYALEGSSEWQRLITSLLEPGEASVDEIVRLYPLRWTQETMYREIKATLKPSQMILRSKSPAMIEQELYGLFSTYYVVRRLMFMAAESQGLPPDELSFKHAVFVIKECLPKSGSFSP